MRVNVTAHRHLLEGLLRPNLPALSRRLFVLRRRPNRQRPLSLPVFLFLLRRPSQYVPPLALILRN